MLKMLNEQNPDICVKDVSDQSFHRYGRILTELDFSACFEVMGRRGVPEEGNVYVACDEEMMKLDIAKNLSRVFYGGMPIQIGYCNGNSSKLNALEYHKGSEIDVAVTDFVLLLGDVRDIDNNRFDSGRVEAFYVPAGTACELYGTTLHFAPCKVQNEVFKSIIVLPVGTNEVFEDLDRYRTDKGEGQLLWMRNKWLIAHAESSVASRGAYVGIDNKNIEIKYI